MLSYSEGCQRVQLWDLLISLPLGAIIRHHNIGYHIYSEDTQFCISFKCKDPLESLVNLNKPVHF